MNKKNVIIFISIFLFVIYAVPIFQAGVEYKKTHSIQALDIVIDGLVMPYKRANTIHAYVGTLDKETKVLIRELDKVSQNDSARSMEKAEQCIDYALVAIADVKKSLLKVNRHVNADTTTTDFTDLDTIENRVSNVLAKIRMRKNLESVRADIESIKPNVEKLITRYPQKNILSIPILAIKNFPNIFYNDKYIRPFEKDMENASVFAQTCRPLMLFTRFTLFNDLGEKAVPGKGGWFFYKPDVDYLVKPSVSDKRSLSVDPNQKPLSDNPIKAIVTFKEQLDSLGIDLLVMIVPVKANIYPEMLNSQLTYKASGKIGYSQEILKKLNNAGVSTVDLFSAFVKERMRDSLCGDSLYLQKDTHWRARGLCVAAQVVADRIKQYSWYIPGSTLYECDTMMVDRSGDIACMTTLPSIKMCGIQVDLPKEKTRCFRVYSVLKDSTTTSGEKRWYKDDYKNSPILILGDSFSRIYQTDEPRNAGWIAQCARELSQPVASLVNDGGASTLVRQSLARKAYLLKGKKCVVWEFVERDLWFGEQGWKDVPLVVTAQ